ncbi:hypothetical protein V8B97DRAFT_1867009 [Scleroderma yunnanense]
MSWCLESNDYVELRTTPYGGRSLFAVRDIPLGARIHSSQAPFAHVIYKDYRREVCAQCFVYAASDLAPPEVCRSRVWSVKWALQGLPGASAAWFCSEGCRKAWEQDGSGPLQVQLDANLTKAQVASRRKGKSMNVISLSFGPEEKITQEIIDEAWKTIEVLAASKSQLAAYCTTLDLEDMELEIARSLVFAIVRQYVSDQVHDTSEPDKHIGHVRFETWSHFLQLQNNELRNVQERPYILSAHLRIYAFLCNTLPTHLKPYLSTVRDVLARDTGNAFGIWDRDRRDEMFGWGIWISASYFNHSCTPNVRKVRRARALHFETSRPVLAGEELCISYVDTDQILQQRRRDLQTSWFFTCSCDRCERESSFEIDH